MGRQGEWAAWGDEESVNRGLWVEGTGQIRGLQRGEGKRRAWGRSICGGEDE